MTVGVISCIFSPPMWRLIWRSLPLAAAHHLAAVDLGYELGQRLLGLSVGAVKGAGLLRVLARAGVAAEAHDELPLAALALGLSLLHLHDGALSSLRGHHFHLPRDAIMRSRYSMKSRNSSTRSRLPGLSLSCMRCTRMASTSSS